MLPSAHNTSSSALDVSFMAPLNSYYKQEAWKWLLLNPGRFVVVFQTAKLFKVAISITEVANIANT